MVTYCAEVVIRIRSAVSDGELQKRVDDSIAEFERRSAAHIASYILNMIVTLQAALEDDETPDAIRHNMRKAMELFRAYNRLYQASPF
ncbi:hypothetical protein [Ohtaekwangia sp.]|uniref:hypothetical protein n=1 Tax=Ohtaekwangia sp. TaxID=2066019 RepID=UPI002F94AB12